MEVKQVKIGAVKPYENNARFNDEAVEYVANSISEFGFQQPIVVDKDMVVIAGHTRLKAAKDLNLDTVPVIVADGLSDEQVKAYRLADNKTGEIAEWDFDKLNIELGEIEPFDIDMEDFGFDLGSFNNEESEEAEEDDFDPDEPASPRTEMGQVWKLGRHRLMVGDSTKKEDVSKLMNGDIATLVFTDPPYGMKKEKDGVLNDNLTNKKLLNFNKEWVPLTFDYLTNNGSWYCWGIDEPLMDIYAFILKPMIEKGNVSFRNLITWDKGSGQGQKSDLIRSYAVADEKCLFVVRGHVTMPNNSADYYSGWDPIRLYLSGEAEKAGIDSKKYKEIIGNSMFHHYFTKSQWQLISKADYEKLQDIFKEKGRFARDWKDLKTEHDKIKKEYEKIKEKNLSYFNNVHDNMNNVWHFDRTTGEEKQDAKGHATPKPLALVARGIKSSSKENDVVLDVFGGSGTTLIVCEKLNRQARLMELDPHWADVIIKRWEDLTGNEAELIE